MNKAGKAYEITVRGERFQCDCKDGFVQVNV